MCPGEILFKDCVDEIAQATLQALPNCSSKKQQDECHDLSISLVKKVFSPQKLPDQLRFELFCREDLYRLVVPVATQRTMEAWCMGQEDLSKVDWARSYDSTPDFKPNVSYNRQYAVHNEERGRHESAEAAAGQVAIIIGLVAMTIVGLAFVAYRLYFASHAHWATQSMQAMRARAGYTPLNADGAEVA